MNALITIFGLATALGIALFVPTYGASAVLICAVVAVIAGLFINNVKVDKQFLLRLFIVGVLVRMLIGTLIFSLHLQEFFGGDANTYDYLGNELLAIWQGNTIFISDIEVFSTGGGWGMLYLVGAIYGIIGRNPLAVQFVNAVLGAATAPLVYLCAQHMFRNLRVARIAAFFVQNRIRVVLRRAMLGVALAELFPEFVADVAEHDACFVRNGIIFFRAGGFLEAVFQQRALSH